MTAVVEAKGLGKSYGSFRALKGVSFEIPLGRIVGVIGVNGAGKTTMLNAILGLIRYDGELKVLGRDPAADRASLMNDVCFISDVATLPRWMRVNEVIDYVEGVHPKFSRATCLEYLGRTKIPATKKIKELSKGMVTQLHLALVMSIDAQLLVLDEPTLGLDILFRKGFYAALLGDYFDNNRTIIVTTHQVEEIEHILTDAMFINDGEVVLYESLDDLAERFQQVTMEAGKAEAAQALNPIYSEATMGLETLVFDNIDQAKLQAFGQPRRVGLADLFVAIMTGADQ